MCMRILNWEQFIQNGAEYGPLSLSIGVFDGVHRGHQELIGQVCRGGSVPSLISFRENPLSVLEPKAYRGEIFSLEQKIDTLEALGISLFVLVDFSENFSKLKGEDFFKLLMCKCRMESLILGPDFRCGWRLDTGMAEIKELADRSGVKVLEVPPVMDAGRPISSSRIREAILAGNLAEAQQLLGRKVQIDLSGMAEVSAGSFDANSVCRVTPPSGTYRAVIGAGRVSGSEKSPHEYEGTVVIDNGIITVPAADSGKKFKPGRLLFL